MIPESPPMGLPIPKYKRAEIAATALWIIVFGGFAVYRNWAIDPFGIDSSRCIAAYLYNRDHANKEDDSSVNAEAKIDNDDPFGAILGYRRIDPLVCGADRVQAILDLRLHPVASILGSLLPAIILSPAVFFLSGYGLRRYQARTRAAKRKFKICEFCAEQIKAEAKVCRYCGREASVSNQPS